MQRNMFKYCQLSKEMCVKLVLRYESVVIVLRLVTHQMVHLYACASIDI